MPKARRAIETLWQLPWALHPDMLGRVVDWYRAGERGEVWVPEQMAAAPGQPVTPPSGVAVIPVNGVIEHHSDWFMELFGGTSVDGLRDQLAGALGDPNVSAVILNIDSPGGTVAGVTELAAEIRAARGGTKPIVAVANAFAASAAYWLGSQADEFVATPSAQVGSIGVYAMHVDMSQALAADGLDVTLISAGPHKVEGNEFEPLSEDARKDIQGRVNASYSQFVADVAAGRRVSTEQVKADMGGGRMMTAQKARAAGMVDRVESLGDTIGRLSRAGGRRRVGAAAQEPSLYLSAAQGATIVGLSEGNAATPSLGPNPNITPHTISTPFPGSVATWPVIVTPDPDDTPVPFAERLEALADEATDLVAHATERARLRAKEGRPAFSTTTERSLRTIRDSLTALLEPDDPALEDEPPTAPVEPVPVEPAPPLAVVPIRHYSDDEWLAILTETGT